MHTRFKLVPSKRVSLREPGGPVERQLMRLDREVAVTEVSNGSAPNPDEADWTRELWSISTLSFFKVEMLDRGGRITNDVQRGDYIFVRFSVVPEWILDPENYIREIYWSTTLKIRPYWDPPTTSDT